MKHQVDDVIVALAIVNRNIVYVGRLVQSMEAHMTQEFEDLQAAADANTAAVAKIADDVTQVSAKIDELIAAANSGSVVTAEQLTAVKDQLNAATASLTASDTTLDTETGVPNP